jgi:hypothetical protein
MTGIIDEIVSRMGRYPLAEIRANASSVTYYPPSPDGFIVRVIVDQRGSEERYRVYYAGCCQKEANREGSIRDFGFGLSTGCRVREFSRCGVPYRWITEIEAFTGWKGYWEEIDFSGPFWQLWRPRQVRVLQNRLIDLGGGCGGGACAAA